MLPELYHAHHNRHLEDIPFWLALATQAGDPILELGCGTGRVIIPLARAGYRCVGLDHDLEMLRFLETNLDPSLHVQPHIVASDISHFMLQELFSLIIFPCNTFSTLTTEQRLSCLSCVRDHLEPRGMFVVSLPNPETWSQLPAQSDAEYEEEFILPGTGNPVQVSSCWQRKRRTFAVTWIYDQLFPDGTVERVSMKAVHFRTPFITYLDEIHVAGFKQVIAYGDYDGSPYKIDSPNLILLAKQEEY
jgi:SAM-dependent methyltransferase